MTCYGCKKKVDPILTFARPHGRYSRCEECRKKGREKARERRVAKMSVVCRHGVKGDPSTPWNPHMLCGKCQEYL